MCKLIIITDCVRLFYSVKLLKERYLLQAHDSPVRTMVWSHNDSWMITGDHAGYVKYWQSNMNNVKMFQAHKEALRGIRYLLLYYVFLNRSILYFLYRYNSIKISLLFLLFDSIKISAIIFIGIIK